MAWNIDDALKTLRTILGDGDSDHYEFKADVTPTADGLHTSFFGGRTRMRAESVIVYVNGTMIAPDEIDEPHGRIIIESAPSGVVQVSYHWQWFTDLELTTFLRDALNMLGFSDIADSNLDFPLRSVMMDLASALAYTRKAAEYAESLQASSPDGYSVDTGKAHPNWAGLAKDAMARSQTKFKWYIDNPLNQGAPGMRLVTFQLSSYMPRT